MRKRRGHSLAVPGIFHVYNRGVNRNVIFHTQNDYKAFVDLLVKFLNPAEITMHGFTLMPNHYHFILAQDQPYAISRFIKSVCENYAKDANRLYRRVGHLFQGVCKRTLVDKESHLLDLSRYIHLNPVHARLCSAPEDWEFGSCRAYFSADTTAPLQTETILSLAGGPEGYREFLNRPPATTGSEIEGLLIDKELL